MPNPKDDKVTVPWSEVSDEDMNSAITFLFYGQSGSGKTYLTGQFPNVLILACDPGPTGGAKSALHAWEKLQPEWDKPKIVRIKTYEQIMDLLPQLSKWVNQPEGFETIAVDSVSYLQRLVMTNLLSKTGREIPRFEEWGLCQERMRNLISRLADFKCTTILTATEQVQRDELLGKLLGTPNLPGKLSTELPQACDLVLRLSVSTSMDSKGNDIVKYRFQSVPDDIWVARDRTGTLPVRGDSCYDSFKHLINLNKEL